MKSIKSRNVYSMFKFAIFFMTMFLIGIFYIPPNAYIKAGTLQYLAEISSSTSGDNITFTCTLNQTVDGQQTSYQWQENRGSGWSDISSATGASYTVNKAGRGGYQYRCAVTVVINNSYSLLNEDYKAFLHREGSVPEFQSWWPHLYGHTQNSYLLEIYDRIGVSPVNEAARVASEMIFCTEYMSKYNNSNLNYSTDTNLATRNGPKQLIVDCYHFLLQREPSDSEVEHWYNEYINHNTKNPLIEYLDPATGTFQRFRTYSGMGYVLNQIAASEECANNMAAAYYYDGNRGVFLYTESDVETRSDTYHVTSDVAIVPENAHNVTLSKGTGIQSVSGAGSYTTGQSVTVNATVSTGYHWKNWTGTYGTTTQQYTFTMPDQDISLTANAEINRSTVRIDPNGGTWNGYTTVQSYTENYGTAKSIPTPTRTGYTFTGWTKSNPFYGSFNNSVYTFGSANGIIDTLTASWTANSYKVTLQKGTGIQNVSGAGSYTVGQSVKIDATPVTGYHWKGWTGTYETDTKQYTFSMPAKNVTLTANAEINYSTLKIDPNGGMWNGSSNVQSFSQAYNSTKNIPEPTRVGYTFKGWKKSTPFYGSFVEETYTFGLQQNTTDILTAEWQVNTYTVTLEKGTGIDDVNGNGVYKYGETVTIDATVSTGYHWRNWTGAYETDTKQYIFSMPAEDVSLTANAEANEYTFYFDPNGGVGTDIPSVTVHYNEAYSFLNGSDYYKKYTLDGVNITTDVINGTIDLDNENVTDPANDPQALQRAYASVYLGWGLESDKTGFIPRWNAYETTSVASIVEAAGVADTNGGSVTLYAIWDDCPWILASDRYFTLNEAHNGVITEEEMFRTAKATDTEDGEIPPGENFILIDFDENELLELPCEATLRIIYQSTDSQGSIYKKSVYIHVVDDLVNPDDPDDPATSAKYQSWVYPRFINSQFFQNADGSLVPEEKGGVAENSVWRTDPAKTALLSETLKAERTGQEVRTIQIGTGSFDVTVAGSGSWTSIQNIWEFTPEDVERSKEFVKDHGWANYVEADGLAKWLQEFDDCKKK